MIDQFSTFVQKRPRIIIAAIIIITALFFIPLSGIEIDTSPRVFAPKSLLGPLDMLKARLSPVLQDHIYAVPKTNASMLSLEALKEQMVLVEFLHTEYGVRTESLAEVLDEEVKENLNKSLADLEDEDELEKVMYDLFVSSPKDFKTSAQMWMDRDYDAAILDKYLFLIEMSFLLPFGKALDSGFVEIPPTDVAYILAVIEDKGQSDEETEQMLISMREGVTLLEFEHIKVLHYSPLLLTYDLDQKLSRNTIFIALMTLVSMSLLILLSFRRLYFVFIPLLIITVALVWTFGTAQLLGLKITALHTFIVALLVGIALDGPLHMTKRFIEQSRKRGRSSALRETLSSMMPALFLTFITTAGAFLAQVILPSPVALFSFGVVVIIGVTYSFILVCLLWPSLVALTRSRRFFDSGRLASYVMRRVYRISMRYSTFIMLLVLVVLAFSAYNAVNIKTDVSSEMYVPDGVPSKEAVRVMNSAVTEYGIQYLLISGDVLQPEILDALYWLEENMQDNEDFGMVYDKVVFESALTLLRAANISGISSSADMKDAFDTLHETDAVTDQVTKMTVAEKARLLIPKDNGGYSMIVASFRVKQGYTKMVIDAYEDMLDDIRQSGLRSIPGISVDMTGTSLVASLSEVKVRRLQVISAIMMFFLTFLVLLFIYRRLGLSIIVATPILIGSVTSLGIMPLLDMPLTWLNATVIPLVIGLGVDYSIYLSARYREELKNHRRAEAARIALEQTGQGLWLAAVTTTLGFLIVSLSCLPMAKSFGILTALSIAFTFVVTIFLLPALLVRFVKR